MCCAVVAAPRVREMLRLRQLGESLHAAGRAPRPQGQRAARRRQAGRRRGLLVVVLRRRAGGWAARARRLALRRDGHGQDDGRDEPHPRRACLRQAHLGRAVQARLRRGRRRAGPAIQVHDRRRQQHTRPAMGGRAQEVCAVARGLFTPTARSNPSHALPRRFHALPRPSMPFHALDPVAAGHHPDEVRGGRPEARRRLHVEGQGAGDGTAVAAGRGRARSLRHPPWRLAIARFQPSPDSSLRARPPRAQRNWCPAT